MATSASGEIISGFRESIRRRPGMKLGQHLDGKIAGLDMPVDGPDKTDQ